MLGELSVAKLRRATVPRLAAVLVRLPRWRAKAWTPVLMDGWWVFRVTREFVDDFGTPEFRHHTRVGDDYDTDCAVYAWRGTAWAVRAQRAWRRRRYCVECALDRRGVLLCDEGGLLAEWHFNWDWRWYERASWGRRAAV